PGAAADLVGAAAGSGRDQLPGVVADRCSRRADERPLVAGVAGHAAATVLAGPTQARKTDHPGAAGGAVRLLAGRCADRCSGRTGEGPHEARLIGERAGAAGRAAGAGAVAADLVRAARRPVALGLLRVGAGHHAFGAGDLTDVTGVGGCARAAAGAGGGLGARVRRVSATRAGA